MALVCVKGWGQTALAPTISRFTPTSACYGSGTSVTITGTNLSTTSAVTFNGTSATFSKVTATSVTAILPSGATTGPISVTTSGGIATSATNFRITPNAFIKYVSGDTATQAPCVGTAITNITYQTTGSATGVGVTGLPNGVRATYSGGTVTVSGTPRVSGRFKYTVTTAGPCNNQSLTGTITVKPNSFITYQTGSGSPTAQTPCVGAAIRNIIYTTSGGTTGIVTPVVGLPPGVRATYSGGTVTVSGTPTVSGTFKYTVTTTGGGCTQQTVTGTIKVNANATIQLTSAAGTDAQSFCSSGNITITPITYQWGGTASGFSLTGSLPAGVHTATNSSNGTFTISGSTTQTGTFKYTVTATGNTCTNQSMSGTITINQTPIASISAAASSSCAAGVQVTISGTTGASVTYTTNGINPKTVILRSGSNQFFTPSDHGIYIYKITSITNPPTSTCTGTTGAANQTATVTVNANPTATITIASSQGTGYVQIDSTISYTGAPMGGTWSSDDITIATAGQKLGTVTGVSSGTANIIYKTANDANGCSGTATKQIIVTADYVTKQIGNFSDTATWKKGTTSGFIINNTKPTSANTIEVQHPLGLDSSFAVTRSFVLRQGGSMVIFPNVVLSSTGTAKVAFNGNSVTVRSDATGNGAIGIMATQILNASSVTVERFIGNGVYPSSKRAWRMLTAPVRGTSIHAAWQEGVTSSTNPPQNNSSNNPHPGYGTLLTGESLTISQATNEGYDILPGTGNHASILQYDSIGGKWIPLTNANGTLEPVSSEPAYMVFVRGDRTIGAGTPNNTTLRATGTLNQGSVQSIHVTGAVTNTVAGNPFASAIDFDQVYHSNSSLIKDQFAIWRANQGTYGAYSFIYNTGSGYAIVPNALSGTGGTVTDSVRYIQSGEGFLVYPQGTGTLTIGESAKASSKQASGTGSTFDIRPITDKKLYVNLNLVGSDSTATLADGIMERFDASYSAQIDGDDAVKPVNFYENLAVEKSATDLIVESRPDVQKTDTIQLKLWNVSARAYELQVKGDNYAQTAATQGLHAYVEDSYLKTRVEVSLSGSVSTIAFAVTSDAASYDSHRFRVVFQTEASSILPITLTSVKAQLQNGGVSVSWSTQNEVNVKGYGVERSVDGGATFSTTIATVAAKNVGATAPLASYQTLDAAPQKGDDYYRIRIEGADGKVTYSNVVKVTVGEDAGGKMLITLYPNPVSRREGKATLSLTNVKEGDYLMSVYSQSGQNIAEKKITVAGGSRSQNESVPLPQQLAQGAYQLQLTDSNGNKVFVSKFIIGK